MVDFGTFVWYFLIYWLAGCVAVLISEWEAIKLDYTSPYRNRKFSSIFFQVAILGLVGLPAIIAYGVTSLATLFGYLVGKFFR